MRITFARSATKHRIPKGEAAFVVSKADGWIEEPPPADGRHRTSRRLYVGRDSNGRWLEIVAVEGADASLVIIHAMLLRKTTRSKWESTGQ